jgi:hypothetical protein
MPDFLTPPQIAVRLGRPLWSVRRSIDRLGCAVRCGLYRLVPADQLERIREDLDRREAEHPRRAAISRQEAAHV